MVSVLDLVVLVPKIKSYLGTITLIFGPFFEDKATKLLINEGPTGNKAVYAS